MTQTQPILSKGTIRSKTFANRMVLAPMSRASAASDGTPTKAMGAYYANFARGGFGLLVAEGAFTDAHHSQSYSGQPGMVTDAHEQGWCTVVEAVKKEHGKIILQLIHAGAVSQHVATAFAPSPVRPKGSMLQGYGHKQGTYEVPNELDLTQIQLIKQGFLQAAKRAERAGFDGVEVHCANGYLLDQFLTEETNLRSDQYGGSLDNRVRLTAEIISDIRAATDDAFLVGVRLSQAKATDQDYFWPNGLKDAETIFSAVAKAGSDFIHIASEQRGYAYHSSTKNGENLTEFARTLTGLPVIANGGLEDADLANEIILANKADFVSLGKAAMLNPDLPKQIASGTSPAAFTFEMFKYGVTIQAQQQWQAEQTAAASPT